MSVQDYINYINQQIIDEDLSNCIARQSVKERNKEISEMLENIN